MNDIRIPYKPDTLKFSLMIAIVGLSTIYMGNKAMTNNKVLLLKHTIELSPQSATIFYWMITGISFIFFLLILYALLKSTYVKRTIIITDTFLIAPKNGLSNIDVRVNFSDVIAYNIQTMLKTKILYIEYKGGKLSIPNTMLPTKKAFEELVSEFRSKINTL